jgi:hypothetical protein
VSDVAAALMDSLAVVVHDVRVALASLVATLVLAALWYVLRVAWDVDVHRRPRVPSSKEADGGLRSASAVVREQTRAVVARARPGPVGPARAHVFLASLGSRQD